MQRSQALLLHLRHTKFCRSCFEHLSYEILAKNKSKIADNHCIDHSIKTKLRFYGSLDLFPVSVYFVDVVLPVPTTNLGLVSHARAIAARAFSFCPYRGWKSISTPYICESSIIGRLHTRLARVAGCCKFACLSQRNISIIIIIR